MSALANMHSVKNRFLLRINNQTRGPGRSRRSCRRFARDLVVVGRVPDRRAQLAAGVRLAVAEPEAAVGEAEGDPGEGAAAGRPAPWLPPGEGTLNPLATLGERVAGEAGCHCDSFLPMRIGILGTRGIPARYGGFETLAEELSARLAARGHDVTVYTRSRYARAGPRDWRGAKIRVLPTIPTKYLDTVVHGVALGRRRRVRALRRRPRLQRDQRGVVASCRACRAGRASS